MKEQEKGHSKCMAAWTRPARQLYMREHPRTRRRPVLRHITDFASESENEAVKRICCSFTGQASGRRCVSRSSGGMRAGEVESRYLPPPGSR